MRYHLILLLLASSLLEASNASKIVKQFLLTRSDILPPGSLVEIVGSFENREPGADYTGNSADFRTVIEIGNPSKVFFESKNFRVPVSGHNGDLYSEYHIVVIGDGQNWHEYNVGWRRGAGDEVSSKDWYKQKRITITPIDLDDLFHSRPLYIKAGLFDASCVFLENMDFFRDSTLFDFDPSVANVRAGSRSSPDPSDESFVGSLNYELNAENLHIEFANINYSAGLSLKLPEMLPQKYEYTFVPDGHIMTAIEFSDYRPVVGQPLLIVPYQFMAYSMQNGKRGTELNCKISSIKLLSAAKGEGVFATPLPHGWKVEDKRIGDSFIIENPNAALEEIFVD